MKRYGLLAVLVVTLSASPARADRLAELTHVISTDASWRVRLQAVIVLGKLDDRRAAAVLERTLRDENALVRGMAAQVLGQLGDKEQVAALENALLDASPFVREKATAALERLHPESLGVAAGHADGMHVEVGGIGAKPNVPQLTKRLRDIIIRELRNSPGITLEGKPLSGFLIDGAITALKQSTTDRWIEVTCEVSYVVGRLPSRAMVMMTSGGATVQAPKMGYGPEKRAALEVAALENAVHGAHENLLSYIQKQH